MGWKLEMIKQQCLRGIIKKVSLHSYRPLSDLVNSTDIGLKLSGNRNSDIDTITNETQARQVMLKAYYLLKPVYVIPYFYQVFLQLHRLQRSTVNNMFFGSMESIFCKISKRFSVYGVFKTILSLNFVKNVIH